MHLAPIGSREPAPVIDPDLVPPSVHGAAILAHRAYGGCDLAGQLDWLGPPPAGEAARAAWLLDGSLARQLHFQAEPAAALQAEALDAGQLFRVHGGFVPRSARPFRLLALMAPGRLMVNTPLDFITAHLDVQLDLLFVCPGRPLPDAVPEHDLAFCAVSECDPAALRRLLPLCATWPRPVLNDPGAVLRLSRDGLARDLLSLPGTCIPAVLRLEREEIAAHLAGETRLALLASGAPLLIRPVGSHAGDALERIETAADVQAYLTLSPAAEFYVTAFVDYRSADRLHRKYRVAFIEGAPFLCHMAASEHWMVHYLNAGMAERAERRADEARAMREFDDGFAVRHADAFAALCRQIGLDYFQIDCAELPDGRLLLFEVAVAGIVHLLDPPDLFPYKPAQMRRVFDAFAGLLERRRHRAAA